MYKSYRFRMYPTTSQIELIHKTFGCTRSVSYTHLVSVSYILSRSKNSFYVNLEDQLILAAKSYYSSHRCT